MWFIGVTLELVSLNGSQAEPVVGCMAETPLGDELQIPSQVDDLGNLTFTFVVDLAGNERLSLWTPLSSLRLYPSIELTGISTTYLCTRASMYIYIFIHTHVRIAELDLIDHSPQPPGSCL